ncbi:UNVERIFIED_CONTAM: Phospholipase SGR2 [Sesamum angustifolium]|uniref:Phospholipase SGR2 n=1 Tax=Sesamum angustifolium TaxID=2727405 RepID=A0AAW2QTY7_9LAMI
MKSDPVPYDDRTDDKDVSGNNKDETIKSLREEIDFLKAKLKEVETERADKDKPNKSTPVVNQSDTERAQSGDRDSSKSYNPKIRYTKLEFKVDTFFAVGSPLGVFLSLRNIRIGIGKGKEYWKEENINEEMPACRRMFNIFHPFDPVAYRIEPLICKEFIHKRPTIIPYHRGGKRLYVRFQEFKEGLASHTQTLVDHLSTIRVKVLTICESRRTDSWDEESEDTKEKGEKSYGALMLDRLIGNEGGRIDHVLQDKTFRHPYISAIGAHTNYWRDSDTALFMLKHLYRDIPEEPLLSSDQMEDSSNDENGLTGWFDPREVADEELPLTFADSAVTDVSPTM